MQHIEGDTGQQMAQLDSRTRQIIDDLKNNITTYQSHADVEREKLEGKLQTALESHAQIRDSFIVSTFNWKNKVNTPQKEHCNLK